MDDETCRDLERRVLAAVDEWGRARREEARAIQTSFDASHRGPAWFARCVAGEQRVAAETDLFDVWGDYDAARAKSPPTPAGAGRQGTEAG